MNKNAIQKFAIWARNELIAQVSQRAYQYGIDESGFGDAYADTLNGRMLTAEEKSQRQELIKQIKEKGYKQVMEEVAYTWFNRFIALRFMEVNNYLPSHIRVFSDASGAFKPEILNDVLHLDLPGLDSGKVAEYIESNDTEALYRYLLLTQCNALNSALPVMFERMGGYTEMLLPNNILRQDSVLGHMVSDIPEEDWQDAVQIIGWLYQYYNTELKDDTFAQLKKNVKITKERIPAATQLFTPDWIVRYMVENSLGRLWLEGHPNAELRGGWKYYLDEAEQEPEVEAQLAKLREEYKTIKPEEIKVIDPCMGSGHILVYAFDVLMQIYTSAGWDQREAAQSILKNNLFGLDIDDRAAQLAYFAVMMKARQYDRRLLTRGIQPNIHSIIESNALGGAYKLAMGDFLLSKEHQETLNYLLDAFIDAKEYGSILCLEKRDYVGLLRAWNLTASQTTENLNLTLWFAAVEHEIPKLIEQAIILTQGYDVVVTNPPYMGASGMNARLSQYIKDHFPDTKADLFACFIERGNQMAVKHGYNCMVTMQSWMFLSSFEKMREKILRTKSITNLMHMENMVMGIAFGTAVTVFRNDYITGYKGTYNQIKLQDIENDEPRVFPVLENRFAQTSTDNFSKIPGSPVAYWVSDATLKTFNYPPIGEVAKPRQGLATGCNDIFIRLWYETDAHHVNYSARSTEDAEKSMKKWFPYNKGGDFRRWYGNNEYVVNWENDGFEIRHFTDDKGKLRSRPQNTQFYFKPCISWSLISSGRVAFRYKPAGHIFDVSGMSCFTEKHLFYLLALCNTPVVDEFLSIFSPTINFQAGDIANIPVAVDKSKITDVESVVSENIQISKNEWDSYETSWDFKRNPLVNGNRLTIAYAAWKQECEARFQQLKKNEEELNRIFIDIYGLQDELTPDVADKDITVHRVFDSKDDVPESMKGSSYVRTMRDEIISLISYAVGCMFGRYSLDVDGLAYAGGEWDASKYKTIIPDSDNIIPICDDEYFDDDITGRFVEFVRKVYGDDTLEENLKFVADALGGKGTPREVIRSYFLNDFYADHLKTYQKRPIYWLFDSGKKNGFKALCYMHRYQRDLLARLRTDYVHEQQERYRTQLAQIGDAIDHASASERVKLTKQQKKFQEQAAELQKYEEKVHHLADQNIEIDLDDGVKHNYELFADVLAKIK